jgi:fructokinase
MSALKPIVTIGDGIIDAVKLSDSPPTLYPGGAGLNLAVGLARLGIASVLAARIGLDRNGFRLMRYLREEGIELINTPNADFTGVATSRRRGGEPSYDFTPSLYRRRIAFNSTLLKAIAEAPAIGVNSFSYADTKQADALSEALSRVTGLKILDPNPRPRLIADLEAFREGFERTIRTATLVRLSGEDAKLLYGREDDGVAESLFERGVEIVLLTRGKLGASLASSPARD